MLPLSAKMLHGDRPRKTKIFGFACLIKFSLPCWKLKVNLRLFQDTDFSPMKTKLIGRFARDRRVQGDGAPSRHLLLRTGISFSTRLEFFCESWENRNQIKSSFQLNLPFVLPDEKARF